MPQLNINSLNVENISKSFFLCFKEKMICFLSAFYDANATGKSNIIKAMKFFRYVVLHGVEPALSDPNRLNSPTKTTLFELETVLEKRFFQYVIEYDEYSGE